ILPQVSVAGIDVGSLTQSEASSRLSTTWTQLTLTDGTSTYNVTTSDLGIQIDADASASRAFEQGHGTGGWIAFIQPVDVPPVITIDANQMNEGLVAVAPQINQVARNAGVNFTDGQAQATEPIYGTQIDIQATINTLQSDPEMIADGTLELVMQEVAPDITDATPLVAEAQALLSSPLDIRVFDPVTGDSIYWSVLSSTWSTWLTATSDPSSPIGLALSVEGDSVRQYLQSQADSTFDSTRTIDIDDAVNAVQNAFSNGSPQDATVIVQHLERTHTVQAGESITSIAWDYGIPYLYVIQANGGLESVSIGQQITIPAADTFISEEFNPNKRIVVSISQQRTYVYENGELLYEWVSSTGIDSSPTWTGVYQVISHVPNAYAENWNLYMPNFIGVYEPVPNSDFTNGFHGFPTRGGGQLLWENSLGRRVTYGCILLSDTHIAILYNWAENGVIVEIRA
ncbi:MAG: L,D-transpeptidase family protein, partial [Chloroflexota bacterium]